VVPSLCFISPSTAPQSSCYRIMICRTAYYPLRSTASTAKAFVVATRPLSLFPGSQKKHPITVNKDINTNNNTSKTSSSSSKSAPVILPYSQSLPTVGHTWCSKCEIRAHAFQKPCHQIGTRYDTCAALPDGAICQSAQNYFRQQRNVMLALAAIVFVVPNIVGAVMS
jgi:hypothetical protein